jgi:hypothetical protein
VRHDSACAFAAWLAADRQISRRPLLLGGGGDDPSLVDGADEGVVVALVLIGIGFGKIGNRPIEPSARA